MRTPRIVPLTIVLACFTIGTIGFSQTASPPRLLDLNSATLEELIALPGIGDQYAAKIINGRPYKMKTELLSKRIIPSKVYRRISKKIIAKQQ